MRAARSNPLSISISLARLRPCPSFLRHSPEPRASPRLQLNRWREIEIEIGLNRPGIDCRTVSLTGLPVEGNETQSDVFALRFFLRIPLPQPHLRFIQMSSAPSRFIFGFLGFAKQLIRGDLSPASRIVPYLFRLTTPVETHSCNHSLRYTLTLRDSTHYTTIQYLTDPWSHRNAVAVMVRSGDLQKKRKQTT